MAGKIHLTSLGCAKNLIDAEWMLGSLVREGYEITLDPQEADALVVNTCSFIGPAKEESIGAILEMAKYKEDRPDTRLVVTGCLAERYGPMVRDELPEVDAFVGTGDFLAIADAIRAPRGDGPAMYVGAQHVFPSAGHERVRTGPPYTAFLKVSEGCNHKCSFCIIPKIRGLHESRPMDALLTEAQSLVETGAREINLIAQDLTAYGRDLPERASLADLLRGLAAVEGVDWIRLLYCYPNYVTGELLEVIATETAICNYVDMPLQHGSDRILRAMRRERSADSLRRLIDQIRKRVPDVTLRSSFIVGFPGETEADFRDLVRFVEEMELDQVGVFRYSTEENTHAETLPGRVSEAVKERRWNELMATQMPIAARRNGRHVGATLEVLACGTDDEGNPIGRTAGQAPDIDGIVFLDREVPDGDLVPVTISGVQNYDLIGSVVMPDSVGA